jgi:DNA primase
MGRIQQKTIDEIYDTARIEEVVGDYVHLKKRGANYIGLCPFHNEKTPSFIVSPAKGIYKCFGCAAGGNSVSFVMDLEHISYPEALKQLAKKYNIHIEEDEVTEEQKAKYNKRESLYLLSEFAEQYFKDRFQNSEEGRIIAQPYAKHRGISPESIKTFGIGYLPNIADAFTKHALQKGFTKEHLSESGLSIFKDNGQAYDRFRDRLLFPIHSISGRTIGFGGRILKNDKKLAKYVNSPESEIYHKSKILYGIFQAKRSITQLDYCILVEGYTDVVSLHQAGITNVVASSGTSLTQDQVRLVKRFTNNLTVIFDGDDAGIKASLRGIDIILEYGLDVNVLLLPDGEDPDSFSKTKSTEDLKTYISEKSVSFIDFKIELYKRGGKNSIAEKTQWLRSIIRSIAKVPDPLKRTIYIQNTAPKIEMEEKILFQELQIALKQQSDAELKEIQRQEKLEHLQHGLQVETKNHPGNVNTPINENQQDFSFANFKEELEFNVLKLLIKHHKEELEIEVETEDNQKTFVTVSVFEFLQHSVSEDELNFKKPIHIQIFNEIVQYKEEENTSDLHNYLMRTEDASKVQYLTHLLHDKYQLSDWEKKEIYVTEEKEVLEKLLNQYIWRYQLELTKDRISEIISELQTAPEEQKRELIGNYQHVLTFKQTLEGKLGREV